MGMTRRKFLIVATAAGGALIVGVSWQQHGRDQQSAQGKSRLSAWIEIHPDNQIFLTLAKSEMGQGVSTALPMLIAEELGVDWKAVQIRQASEPLNPELGHQETGGSSSVTGSWQMLRQAGARVRELLITAAAQHWQVDRATLYAQDGLVHEKDSQRHLAFGELVVIAKTLPLPKTAAVKDKRDYQLIGKDIARIDLADRLTGTAKYGSDIKFENSVVAVIKHCPQFGGTAPRIRNAEQVLQQYKASGLVETIISETDFVAVVARDFWVANKVIQALNIDWQVPANPYANSAQIYQLFADGLDKPGAIVKQQGTMPAEPPANLLEAIYSVPFQAHATMEPMTCSAYFHAGIVEVWAPTQNPAAAYSETLQHGFSATSKWWKKLSARISNRAASDIKINTTYLGCGLGRRLQQDYVRQAVLIAKRLSKPVNLIWSREEDLQHDYYRPGNMARLRATLDANGYPTTWEHKIAGPSISMSLWPGSVKNGRDHLAFEPANRIPYAIANQHIEYVATNTPVPIGMWRSVGLSQNTFAIEAFIDELAHQARRDPVAYRRSLLAHDPRYLKLLDSAVTLAGWDKQGAGQGYGIALERSYGSYIVTIVKVSRKMDVLKVDEVISVVDCGQCIHPDIVRAQIEGAVVFALSAAMYGEITFDNGATMQSNFHDYPLMSLAATPRLTVQIIDSDEEPGGVGELGVPPVAPALVNAIFSLSGRRIRKLPIALNKIQDSV